VIQPRLVILLCVALGGCALIDQTTFAPSPEAKPRSTGVGASAAGPSVDPRTPLAIIDFTSAQPDYESVLSYAVRTAETRDRTVQYDVIAVTPTAEEAAAGQTQAVDVMRSMLGDRVPASRIHLGLRTEPTLAANQVRVYVR
jgi:hypothetical protein